MRESYLEKIFESELKKAGGWALKLYPTIVSGIPDRLALLPGGRAVFVELKAPGKKPRKLQILIHNKLKDLGFEVEVLDTKERVYDFINRRTAS